MVAEQGTEEVRPLPHEERSGEADAAAHRDPSFLSTRLLRELLGADARSESAHATPAARADALLSVVLGGLDVVAAAIVQVDAAGQGVRCSAARGVPDHARELLERQVAPDEVAGSLVQRALAEHRVLLLDRATREPLMPALRDGSPDIECAALVPLVDLSVPAGALLLAARAGRLSPPLLRSLAVAFRLLGILLSPARGRAPAAARLDEGAPASPESERDLFELEELASRLNEAREAARRMEERATSADAALRAEVETWRARVAELEAQLAGQEPTGDRIGELEDACAAQARALDDRDSRIASLEHELRLLHERLEEVERDPHGATGNGATSWAGDEVGDDETGGREDEPPAQQLDLGDGTDVQLGDIAAEAAAAMDDGANGHAAPGDDAPGEVDLGQVAAADEPVSDVEPEEGEGGDPALALALLHLDSAREALELTNETVAAAGAAYWCGDGDAPAATTQVIAANLFDPGLAEKIASLPSRPSAQRWIVYACDAEEGLGFELQSCALMRRPIEPRACIEQMRHDVKKKLGGIVLVSAQLRELAPLREALHENDAAGSVACDVRQALDLLEIVRRPDAIVLDLALPHGQALTLAAQLRRQPETSDLPLFLLLPAQVDRERLRADAERAQLLGPFAPEDVRRVVRAALAGRY